MFHFSSFVLLFHLKLSCNGCATVAFLQESAASVRAASRQTWRSACGGPAPCPCRSESAECLAKTTAPSPPGPSSPSAPAAAAHAAASARSQVNAFPHNLLGLSSLRDCWRVMFSLSRGNGVNSAWCRNWRVTCLKNTCKEPKLLVVVMCDWL